MPMTPIVRESVTDAVHAQLLGSILDGEFAADGRLPAERRLADRLGVSRPAVREALQRLARDGVIEVRHGEPTRIRGLAGGAGLGVLPDLVRRDGRVDRRGLDALHTLRREADPLCAAAVARRAPTSAVALRPLVTRIGAASTTIEGPRSAAAFWRRVAAATGELGRTLLANDLLAAQERLADLDALAWRARGPSLADGYAALVDRIEAGDGIRAAATAMRLLTAEQEALLSVLDADTDIRNASVAFRAATGTAPRRAAAPGGAPGADLTAT